MMPRFGARVFLLVAGGLALAAGPAPSAAEEARGRLIPYLRASAEGAVGEVIGRASTDARHPAAPPVPTPGVSVVLLPYSRDLEVKLDGIKQHFRDSLKRYMEAADDVMAARSAEEEATLWAGAGELMLGEVSDGQGLVRLTRVPAGAWLMLAWREETHPAKAARSLASDARGFRDIPMSAGYSVVSYWRTRLEVRAGEATEIDLNDRNVWLTGIRENVYLANGRPSRSRR